MNDTRLDVGAILDYLPHRYPFLLVDRVLDYVAHESIRGLKNVTINEPFFPGHFPGQPVMPGVLQIEAMAQLAGVLVFASAGTRPDADHVYYLAGIDKARFKRPVVPGDQLQMEASLLTRRRQLSRFSVRATVDGELASEAEIMCVQGQA